MLIRIFLFVKTVVRKEILGRYLTHRKNSSEEEKRKNWILFIIIIIIIIIINFSSSRSRFTVIA